MKNICINLGSNPGFKSIYTEKTSELARTLIGKGYNIVYGGADVGLMGTLANTALECGGNVIGVIPEKIKDKVAHNNLSELHVVKDMHERKMKMFELSDGFIALPGGFGTIEEIFEILTWA
ncbi:MAG: TIGR00730 family Rossman fold protein, partial [Candidatus Latescibacteria bacterium]|nr:TIGR00730 family Rossman fold protein [Candidatus Latescibacterota bacterium]